MDKKNQMIIGNNTIAVDCLDYLMRANQSIAAVVVDKKDNGKDGWQKSLKKAALNYGLKTYQPDNINDPDFINYLKRLNPDFIFSIQWRQILKKQIIDLPKGGIINLHFALLPKYRGFYPIAWALMNCEIETGVTLHYINEGIDAGDIIAQKRIEILEEDTGRSLFAKATKHGLELFRENFKLIIEGKNTRTKQDDSGSSYYSVSSIDFKENQIKWNKPTEEAFNWIRAFIFPPFQYPTVRYDGREIEIAGIKKNPGKGRYDKAGKIIEIDDGGIIVSTDDGSLLITKIKAEDKIISAKEFINVHSLKVGEML